MGTRPLYSAAPVVLGCALAVACSGRIEQANHGALGAPDSTAPGVGSGSHGQAPGASPSSGETNGKPGGSNGNDSDPSRPGASDPGTDTPEPFAPANATLRRLTVAQYQNSVRDLLGPVQLTVELEADEAINGFVEIGAASSTLSPSAVEKLEAAAFEAAEQALTKDKRATLVGCDPTTVTDSKCTQAFVRKLGRRAFRRPLSDEEVTRYATLADNAAQTLGDFWQGVPYAIAGLLQSPSFLFRVELGEADPGDPTRLRYSGYEMASRLSYLFWNTTPDDELLDAAERGDLTDAGGLSAQIARLAADPRARDALANFHLERLGLEDLTTLSKDAELFPQMGPALATSMRDDILRTIEYVTLDRGGDFRDLLTTRVSFVDAPLAELYGVKAPSSGTQRVELPADGVRIGILGKAGLLALGAHVRETSPTRRGKLVRERVLCQSIPAPPPNVVAVLPEPDPSAATMRERLERHRSDAVCAGCHSRMDPIGLTFENFDALGAYRADDDGHALDVSGDLDGTMFDGPEALAQLLHDDPEVATCMVRQLYRYATAHVEGSGEEIVIRDLAAGLPATGYRVDTLLQAIVASDGFRYAAQENP